MSPVLDSANRVAATPEITAPPLENQHKQVQVFTSPIFDSIDQGLSSTPTTPPFTDDPQQTITTSVAPSVVAIPKRSYCHIPKGNLPLGFCRPVDSTEHLWLQQIQ
ncbi:hypothetical protein BGZ74_003943, partial [Mortierella antarctica]